MGRHSLTPCRAQAGDPGTPTLQSVEVLLWLVPATVATVFAMVWATWTGRRARRSAEHDRRSPRDDEAARARLGAALARPVPARAGQVVGQTVERGTGVAIRSSTSTRRPQAADRPAPGTGSSAVRN